MIQKTLENLKIESFNELQLASIEAFRQPGDLILLSPTGSGKTIGFLMPVLTKLKSAHPGIQALILAPSRELVLQIEQVFRSMATVFKVNSCYGGHAIRTETNNLKTPPAVLIGTPGRIADHLSRGRIDPTTIQLLVLDEFDKSLELGFQQEMSFIIGQLRNLKKRILTSATNLETLPPFTRLNTPITLNWLTPDDLSPAKLQVKSVMAEGKDKLNTLFRLICKVGNEATLVFCNHRDAVERVSNLLWTVNLTHDIFHGGMEQEDRERVLLKFRNGSLRVLITTDLAARGLDIPEIRNIIHYQMPTTENAFIHRNGRTARMNASGNCWLILAKNETPPSFITEPIEAEPLLESYPPPQQPDWVTLCFASGKKDKINKTDIVGLLLQKGSLQKEEVGLIEVKDFSSFVAVKREKAEKVVRLLKEETIKRRKVKIAISR